MENVYLLELIKRLEHELEEHKTKFAGSSIHSQCPERFRNVIATLKQRLEEDNQRLRDAYHAEEKAHNEETVRGDELEPARLLFRLAKELEQERGDAKKAEKTREQAWEFVAKQLNEFDGFNR